MILMLFFFSREQVRSELVRNRNITVLRTIVHFLQLHRLHLLPLYRPQLSRMLLAVHRLLMVQSSMEPRDIIYLSLRLM